MQADLEENFQNQQIHTRWEEVYRKSKHQVILNQEMMSRIVSCLKLPPNAKILDAGCGTGEHTIRLAQNGFECVGVDLSEFALSKAARRAQTEGLSERIRFEKAGLEDLSSIETEFDAVHCRGVLMHIPRWDDALAQLCAKLKPGGRIVLMEGNHTSIETRIVRAVRLFRRGDSVMLKTPGGFEFRTGDLEQAPVTRVADIRALARKMDQVGVSLTARFASEFWDVNRFPDGLPRHLAVHFNRAYFKLNFPAYLSFGNIIIGEKRDRR